MQAHFREQVKDAFEEGIQQTVSKFQEAGIVGSDWTADQLVFRTRGTLQFTETTELRGGKTQQGEFKAGFRRDVECGGLVHRRSAFPAARRRMSVRKGMHGEGFEPPTICV